MERPFNPKFGISKPVFKPKLIDKYHQPSRPVDESLVSRLFLLLDEGNIGKITDFIISNRMLVNVRNDNGDSPVHTVIKSTNIIKEDKLVLVKFLLSNGSSPSAINKQNIAPIHLATQEQLVDVVKLLLEYRADPNSLDANNMNTLHYAVLGKNIKCPAHEDQYLVPKRKKQIVTDELRLVQDIADSVNQLFFNWPTTQRLFKNIFNNINNFDVLYADKIDVKRQALAKDISDIIKNRGLTEEEKRKNITDKLDNIAHELEGIFMADIGEALTDMSKDISIENGAIELKHDDIKLYYGGLNGNILKEIKKINGHIDDFINIAITTKNTIDEIQKHLENAIKFNNILGANYNISLSLPPAHEKLYKQNSDYYFYTDLLIGDSIISEIKNTSLFDIRDIMMNDPKYDIYDVSLTNNNIKSYLDIKKTYNYIIKLKNTNTNIITDYNINPSKYTTFLKQLYIYNDIFIKNLEIIKHNIKIISIFTEQSESWNIAIHILPSILISLYGSLRLLKLISDYYNKYKNHFINIQKIVSNKKNINGGIEMAILYDEILKAIDNCQQKYSELEKQIPQYFVQIKDLITNYNTLVEIIAQLEGVKELESYYKDWKNNQDIFLEETFTGDTDYFCNDLNIFKIKLGSIKKIDDIPLESEEYLTKYLRPILDTEFCFFPSDNRIKKIQDISDNNIKIMYPDYTDKTPFTDTEFMKIQDPYVNHSGNYNKLFFTKPRYNTTEINRTIEKRLKNCPSIMAVLGNHIKLLKYYILYYVANATFDSANEYDTIVTNINKNIQLELLSDKLEEYKAYIIKSMKLTESEFGIADKKLLVELMSETFNNFVKFLINQVSKKIAYGLLEKYSSSTIDALIPIIETPAEYLMPIFQTDDDRNLLNLGLKTKLTVEDIKNIDRTYDEYIDEAMIREPEETKDIIIKSRDSLCMNINLELINLLLANRTSKSQKDNSGKMPINYALEFKNLDLINLLINNFGYKENSPESTYFKNLLKQTIEELVNDKSYSNFYSRYEAKLVKQLEYIPEINTNILSSVSYTVPMFMTLLNTMLFTNIVNFDYGYTYESLNELLELLGQTKPEDYYGPIVCQIINKSELIDYSKKLRNSKLQKQLDIITSRMKLYENQKAELEKDLMTRALFDDEKVEGELDSEGLLEEVEEKIKDSDKEYNKLRASLKEDNISNYPIDKSLRLKIKNTSSFYDNIFVGVLNSGYNSNLNVKLYKALWQNYHKNLNPNDFITNIHLKSVNWLVDNLGKTEKADNLKIIKKLFATFDKISKDYNECPLEYNTTNPHLLEVMKLITHTTTHTVFNYMYITITSMLIKQLEATYSNSKTMGSDHLNYQKRIVKLLKETLTPEFIEYMFRILPECATKIILNIYADEDDPDRRLTLDGAFNYVFNMLTRIPAFIIQTKQESPLIDNIKSYVIPYYREYTKVIVKELFTLSNNFFKHLSGMRQMLEIHEKLIN